MRSQKKQFDAHPQQLTERLSTLSEKGARIETRMPMGATWIEMVLNAL
jgi:hypothetical protein